MAGIKFELDGFVIKGSDRIGKYSKWDLFSYMTVAKGKHKGKKINQERWYDCTLEKAFKEIIRIRLNEGKEELNFDNFLETYKEISDKTQIEINKVNETLQKIINKNKN